jgi:LysR family transcriptional regulator, glycine cleavage system transcriptional activator
MHGSRDLPSLDLLKAFEAAARHLSFTKAGAELFLSQSAISRQIQMLEAQLGARLFERRVRSLLLTDSGQVFYREVGPILEKLREVTAKVAVPQSAHVITVTSPITFASLWLVPRLSDFQRRYPDFAVHLAADNTIRDMKKDRLDVAIRYSTRKLAGDGAIKLFGERVLPVCSPEWLSRHPHSTPEDLKQSVLLHFEDPEGRAPWLSWNIWFEVMGTTPPSGKGSLHFSHYDQVIRAALAGQGIALGRLPLVEELIRAGKLATPLKGARYSMGANDRSHWLVTSPLAATRREVQAFVTWLREQAAPARMKQEEGTRTDGPRSA